MNDASDFFLRIVIALLVLGIWVVVLGGALGLLHFLLSLPLRRAERARLLLDLIETAIRLGQPVEQALISISLSREQSLGVRFHLFVAWLQKGLRLDEAFAKVPSLLPPPIVAMLNAGLQIGDLRKVLPACRQLLVDAVSETRSALNYLVIITFVVSPVSVCVFCMIAITVFPKLNEVGLGMGVEHSNSVQWLFEHRAAFIILPLILQAILWLAAFLYVAGPRFRHWVLGYDLLHWSLPWRRKRMQRDFSLMLATLLDSRMPEPEAVALAATCTANHIFQNRAVATINALKHGQPLTDAMQCMDDTGEFRWRLANAVHSRSGFLSALGGWHEALNAKSFQQQQAAAHLISTALVLLHGLFVGVIVIAVFAFLISIVNAGCLW